MDKICTNCTQYFEIFEDVDLPFYEKLGLNLPTMCPDCRTQRRMMFRNFFNLYHRTCDLTGKKIISMYDSTVPFPVYEIHEWWSDKWDGLSHGLEINMDKPIFEHIEILHRSVPRMATMNTNCENSDYCNFSVGSKNCYLVFGNVDNENCAYGHIVWHSENCYDCLYVYRSQYLYNCTDCYQCYNLTFSRNCINSSDSNFLVNCTNVRNSFGCIGLSNKEYCIFNVQYSKKEYEKKRATLDTGSRDNCIKFYKDMEDLVRNEPVRYYTGYGNENCIGDYLYNCKNIYLGFDMKNSEDSRYCATADGFIDCFDCNFAATKLELGYQCVLASGYKILGCHNCTNCANLYYSDNCYNCRDCFGCVGLKNKQYCIFNKQYSEEEYTNRLDQLIKKMQNEGTFGSFFPAQFSPFAYNESIASHYFPLSNEKILQQGLRLKDAAPDIVAYQGPKANIPDHINNVDSKICEQVLVSSDSGKFYKIIPQELEFYKRMKVPVPTTCFMERHQARFTERNARSFWERSCAQCKKSLHSTYSPSSSEKVLCEDCYRKYI